MYMEWVGEEMDREEASWWQEDVVGTVVICLLGFANWSNGYGVCLHLSVQHPLWSLEKNIRKYVLMRICNINSNNCHLFSTYSGPSTVLNECTLLARGG